MKKKNKNIKPTTSLNKGNDSLNKIKNKKINKKNLICFKHSYNKITNNQNIPAAKRGFTCSLHVLKKTQIKTSMMIV